MSESSQIQKLTYTDDNGEEYEIFIETKSVDFPKDGEPENYSNVRDLKIPDEGMVTHLRGFGFIKLFRKDFKKKTLDTILSIYPQTNLLNR